MATIRERLIYAIEVVGDEARRGITGIRQSVAEADGAINKFKAGASAAMASVGVSAGTLAVVGGGALVAFGVKAVGAAQETALAAGKLADATGLTVEQASRLREVGADLGVSGETITTVVKKMTVELGKGNPLLEQYGIELQRTADGGADVNATLLDTIQRIGAIEDPTKRAAAAQAAFGRGYAEAAELIFTNADQLKNKLDEVSSAKVVTDKELARARKFRDNLEELKDVSEDLTVVAGEELIPILSDLAVVLVDISEAGVDAKDAIEDIPGGRSLLDALGTNLFELPRKSKAEWDELGRKIGIVPDKAQEIGALRDEFNAIVAAGEDLNDVVDAQGNEVEELGARWSAASIELEAASGSFAEMGVNADEAAANADAAAAAAASVAEADERDAAAAERRQAAHEAVADAMERQLFAGLQLIGGETAVRAAQRRAAEETEKLNEVLANEETTLTEAAAAIDAAADAHDNAAEVAAQYREQQLLANGSTVDGKVQAQLYEEELRKVAETTDGPLRAALDAYIAKLDNLDGRTVTTNIVLNTPGRVGDFAAPEVGGVAPLVPVPTGGNTTNVYITTTGELAPQTVVDALNKYDRLNIRT